IRTDLRGTFFSVSPQRVRTTLRKLPWVRDLTVRRRWPFALDLDIEEHRAVGYWGDNDLLSERGEVFRAGSKAPMPRFDGPPGSATDVLSRYREARTALAAHGLDIKVFAMSPRGAITLTTGNDMQIEFGREHYQDRLARFVALYGAWPASFRSGLARIDLRYKAAVAVARNGAALNVESQKGQS
ncbi:MAG TPA: cell division protein FtsQ/DivIB, partial [Casimicrobium huifangae]|nr:cell division protein FtsQ/DivIB [Casimicrobium huifangae]